jgi:hypothetical protein
MVAWRDRVERAHRNEKEQRSPERRPASLPDGTVLRNIGLVHEVFICSTARINRAPDPDGIGACGVITSIRGKRPTLYRGQRSNERVSG